MRIKHVFFVLLVLFTIATLYNSFYTVHMISGVYRYDFPFLVAEGPSVGDQLLLNENGTFESDTWGKGSYEISGSRLKLSSKEIGCQLIISRELFFGEPRLEVVQDLNYYFKRMS